MKRPKQKTPADARLSAGAQPPAKPVPPSSPTSRRRLWLFRFAAMVLVPLGFFALLELSLRVAGFGYPTGFFLPARVHGQEVLIQNDRFAWRFLGRELSRKPRPLAIPRAKPPGTVRVFVFGESAAYGDPQPEFGLPRMLEALLTGRYPGVAFEVVNVGMTAISSHAILPIAHDCAKLGGDVWVIYMGNNEVVGPFGSGTVFGPRGASRALIRASLALKTTRLGQLLDALLSRAAKRTPDKTEWGGMQMFVQNQVRQDDPRMATVYANFERNLADILQTGRSHGAAIVVSTVAANLKDCAPFGSLHRPGLQPAQLAAWETLFANGTNAAQAGRLEEAVDQFRQAAAIDDSFAELHFRWGRCCLALGRSEEALTQFTLAQDQDTLRFRSDSRLNEILRRCGSAGDPGVRVVNGRALLAEQSPDGLPGKECLYEHVHLRFEGNYLLARAVAEQVAQCLPEPARTRAVAGGAWPSADDCARRLGWSDWSRGQGETEMFGRISDPPFTAQSNHAEQSDWLRKQIEQCLAARTPAGLQEAETRCRAALALAPQDWNLHRNLALVRTARDDLAGAVESWRKVVELMPFYAEGWQELGLVLAAKGSDAEAQTAFATALQQDPTLLPALTGLGRVLARAHKTAEAIASFERLLRLKPYWGPAHLELGQILEAEGKKDEAERHYREALRNRIHTPAAYKALAKFCFDKGWYAEAATNFCDALRLAPADAPACVNLGLTWELLGRQPDATAEYAEAVRLDPNLAEARMRLGTQLGRQGKDAEALEQFAAAAQLKPDLLEARLNLGIALVKLHRGPEALAQFDEVLKRDPANAVAQRYVQQLRGAAR